MLLSKDLNELHSLFTLLGLLVIYAFFHCIDIFINLLTHQTILDRFRIGSEVTLILELKLWLSYLRCVFLLLISDLMILLLRSQLNLLLLNVVITDVITVILSAQRKLLICLSANKVFLVLFLLLLNHWLLHRFLLHYLFLNNWWLILGFEYGVWVDSIALDFLNGKDDVLVYFLVH